MSDACYYQKKDYVLLNSVQEFIEIKSLLLLTFKLNSVHFIVTY